MSDVICHHRAEVWSYSNMFEFNTFKDDSISKLIAGVWCSGPDVGSQRHVDHADHVPRHRVD